jgi:drug/metabolite transporter (DMT)-like permease
MRRSRQIIAVLMGVLGAALIVRAVYDGQVWPISLQLIAGVLLLVMAGLRWWTVRR